MPVAATVNAAFVPSFTVSVAGCAVMVGGTGCTVSTAAWLVTEPAELLTITV